MKIGEMVFVDDVFDRTRQRESSFYDGKPGSPVGICHIPMHEPFCKATRSVSDYIIALLILQLCMLHHCQKEEQVNKGRIVTVAKSTL